MKHTHHTNESNLKLAFFLNFSFAVAEIIGGYLTNSIAIMADALHDLGDSVSLALSWRLEKLSEKEGDKKYSYGYKRFSLLSALAGALILIAGSIIVIIEAMGRLQDPQRTDARGMLVFAIFGVAINGFAAFRAGRGKNLNSRVIYWHLLEDAIGWMAVLIVSLVLLVKEIYILDPILSLFVSGFVLFNVVRNLRKTVTLFLQGVPESIQIPGIEAELLKMKKVKDLHHTHIWSLDGENNVLTTHIVLSLDSKKEDIRRIKDRIRKLAEQYDLVHTTVEFEYLDNDCSMCSSYDE
ncbi:MAG: cation transporter [Anaerolineaceae bacterium]|nr:cation transporter [Anaerolineaceae bacterium]